MKQQNSKNKNQNNKVRQNQKKNTKAKHTKADHKAVNIADQGKEKQKISKPCLIYMAVLILVYTILVFIRLGGTSAPKTALPIRQGGMIELSFTRQHPAHMVYYLGPGADRESYFDLYVGDVSGELTLAEENLQMQQVFSWQAHLLPEGQWNALSLRLLDERAILFELVFLDENGNVIYPDNAASYQALFDETALLPHQMSTQTETYFDEVYHARTGFEYLHHLPAYEGVHPPVGKILIMLSIATFGMNPFGWRFMNAVFGILIIPLVFSFVGKLTKKEWIGAFGATLYTFDFMHFAESRIATLDIFCAFFILLMYERFLAYCIAKQEGRTWKEQRKILLGGAIATALAVSSKWTGIFAGFGLAVMFLFSWIWEGVIVPGRLKSSSGMTEEAGDRPGQKEEKKDPGNRDGLLKKSIIFTLASYFGITAVVYFFSYLPHISFVYPEAGFVQTFFIQQKHIFTYHTGLEDTHPFESTWLEWPLMKRPLLMVGYPDGDYVRANATFGNPLIWWGGLAALILVLVLAILDLVRKKDAAFAQRGIFLVLSYLAQFLPWSAVHRSTFIYHYFPCVAFLVGALALLAMRLWEKGGAKKAAAYMIPCAAVAVSLFVLFYPVLSGMRVSKAYIHNTLEWGSRWDLTGEETSGDDVK